MEINEMDSLEALCGGKPNLQRSRENQQHNRILVVTKEGGELHVSKNKA